MRDLCTYPGELLAVEQPARDPGSLNRETGMDFRSEKSLPAEEHSRCKTELHSPGISAHSTPSSRQSSSGDLLALLGSTYAVNKL